MTICPGSEELRRWLEAGSDTDPDGSLAAHLETCTRCQEELERLTALGGTAAGERASRFSTPVVGGNELERTVPVLNPLRCLLHKPTQDPGQALDSGTGRSDGSLRQAGLPVLPGYEMEAEHTDTLDLINNLACVLLLRHRAAEACPLFEACLPPMRQRHGAENLRVVRVEVCYAAALAASGRNAEAEALFERVLPVQRRVLPAADPTLLFALQQQALASLTFLNRTGKQKEKPCNASSP